MAQEHKTPVVYLITHPESNSVYVGSTNDIQRRQREHNKCLRKGNHPNPKLQEAFNRNAVIEYEVIPTATRDEAYAMEQKLMDDYRAGGNLLNISPVANNSIPGWKQPEESIERMRLSSTGKSHTEESRQKMSDMRRGIPKSDEARAKHSETLRARARPISINGVEYAGIQDAVDKTGMTYNTISNRIRSNSDIFSGWKWNE
jgi:group I intron endonuclease